MPNHFFEYFCAKILWIRSLIVDLSLISGCISVQSQEFSGIIISETLPTSNATSKIKLGMILRKDHPLVLRSFIDKHEREKRTS